MQDDFDVRLGAEAVAAALELGLQLDKIVDLAVANQREGPVFVGDRLVAAGEVDDAEAPKGEAHPRRAIEAVAVGTAMHHEAGHAGEHCPAGRPGAVGIGDAGNSAHWLSFDCDRRTPSLSLIWKGTQLTGRPVRRSWHCHG